MLTIKPLHRPTPAHNGAAPKPKSLVKAIAITALATLLLPSISSLIGHQMRLQAANGKSCFRVSPDRKSQVRKYGADCSL